ncbi:C1 family peptidase [Bifidobacterium animalis]|uniref:C1 family peptidase n=1 Tax=Bifidobacterium animalis TaxID=28025 RepID=UPI003C12BF93
MVTKSKKKTIGHQCYFIMNDSWFDQYMYEVAVRKAYLPEEYQKALETAPEVLPYWNTFTPEP